MFSKETQIKEEYYEFLKHNMWKSASFMVKVLSSDVRRRDSFSYSRRNMKIEFNENYSVSYIYFPTHNAEVSNYCN